MSKPVYITTSIAYVNADPHIGFAMESIEADAIARYFHLLNRDTYFLTGTDEHGVKQQRTAEALGISPQELCDRNAKKFQALKGSLNLCNDDFIRTTDQKRHWPAVRKLWKKLVEAGEIYKDSYTGLYCSGCESFKTEKELVDGKCPMHNREPDEVVEKNYFFRLSKYADKLAELIESKQIEIIPEFRAKEILNIIKGGLQDVSFSRPRSSLQWGVPVPNDDAQVMYVWCDALTNYISAIGYAEETEQFKKYWPNVIHVIGKDIVRFHVAIWPAMLMAAGVPVPEKIFVHGFITSEGQKMSKSLGNVVNPQEMVDKYGTDALRYYLLSEIPVGLDGDFSMTLFEERYNAHLANSLGNLVNRVLLMTRKYFDGQVPPPVSAPDIYEQTWTKYQMKMEKLILNKGLSAAFEYVDFLNKYIEEQKPWKLAKEEDQTKLAKVMFLLLESLRQVSLMLTPFLPETAQKIRNQLNLPALKVFEEEKKWNAHEGEWKEIGETEILFPRIEK